MPDPAGLREGVPLARLTSLGIGGPARWFLEVASAERAAEGLDWAARRGVPLFVLGGGSNLVIADDGFPGLVLKVMVRGVEEEAAGERRLLRVGAGEEWDPLVASTVARGWGGLECLSGIPGSVGATPIQNVGAYGQEVAETVVGVEALSRESGRARRFTAAECGFAYRDSVFKGAERERWIILAVTYALRPGAPPAVRYPELAGRLEAEAEEGEADIARVRTAVLSLRRRKGMVLDPDDSDTRSDGSFFVNPVLPAARLDRFLELVASRGIAPEQVPRFPAPGGVKLSAAWLIERTGFAKGHRHGGVGISSKHALAIVNRGGGTAVEVVELARQIRRRVEDAFEIQLEPEPSFVGFAADPLADGG